MADTVRAAHLFVVPAACALPTGGNVYNEGLLAALGARGEAIARCEWAALDASELNQGAYRSVWLDSLYLAHWPELSLQFSSRACSLARPFRLGLLLHALPSSLARAEGRAVAHWLALEQAAFAAFDCALVTSATMAAELAERAPSLPNWVLEPAIRRAQRAARRLEGNVRALIVANLTPNKGLLPWLAALVPRLRENDAFALRCLGRFDLDPAYAQACLRLVDETPALAQRVTLTGVRSQSEVLEELAYADVLISPSRGESFGLAIAEARASGLVVLARAGGHVARLVDAAAGGVLVADDEALADAFLACVRDRAALSRRLDRAFVMRLAARGWDDVAREFSALLHAQAGSRNAQ